jgi:hypothetical protein
MGELYAPFGECDRGIVCCEATLFRAVMEPKHVEGPPDAVAESTSAHNIIRHKSGQL